MNTKGELEKLNDTIKLIEEYIRLTPLIKIVLQDFLDGLKEEERSYYYSLTADRMIYAG